MSLSMPEASSFGDDDESTGEDAYICSTSENLIAVIERCLDNGLGTCLVVEDDNRLVGRVTLDDIGKAVLEGALLNPTLGQHMEALGRRLQNDVSVDANVLRPQLDAAGVSWKGYAQDLGNQPGREDGVAGAPGTAANDPTTNCPGLTEVTSDPTSSTKPTYSWPIGCAASVGSAPR